MLSVSAALQTISEMFIQAVRSCAVDLICSKYSLLLIVGIGNDRSIDLALVISLFNVVTIVSRGLPLYLFPDLSKLNFIAFTAGFSFFYRALKFNSIAIKVY